MGESEESDLSQINTKKIGIVSFHRSYNYGSVLQTYALQNAIRKIKSDVICEHIDFYPPNLNKTKELFVPVKSFRNLIRNIAALSLYPMVKKRNRDFENFVSENIKLSEKKWDEDSDISQWEKEYDLLIAGSDQIWNRIAEDFSKVYFFEGIHGIKKAAYAPSIGNGYFGEKDEEIKKALLEFDFLSVREISGAEKLSKFLKREKSEIPVVLDPTLLLEEQDYGKIKNDRLVQGKYIFLYSVNVGEETLTYAKKMQKRLKLPLYSIYSGKSSIRLKKNGIKIVNSAAPQDFLSMIANATYVITDSFHGTAFSIIFKKNFYSICSRCEEKRDARIDSILKNINLSKRMLFLEEELPKMLDENIDYDQISASKQKIKNVSEKFLERVLECLEEKEE